MNLCWLGVHKYGPVCPGSQVSADRQMHRVIAIKVCGCGAARVVGARDWTKVTAQRAETRRIAQKKR